MVRSTEEEQFEEKFYNNLPTAETNALITMVAFLATTNSGQDFVKYSGHLVDKLNSTYVISSHTGAEETIPTSHDPTSAKILQPVSTWRNVDDFSRFTRQ